MHWAKLSPALCWSRVTGQVSARVVLGLWDSVVSFTLVYGYVQLSFLAPFAPWAEDKPCLWSVRSGLSWQGLLG